MRTEGAAVLDPARSRIRSGMFGPSVQLERAAVDVEAGGEGYVVCELCMF